MLRSALPTVLVLTMVAGTNAFAQAPAPLAGGQAYGARAGGSYVPSTHEPGCGGVLCDGNDPQRLAGPPPPCEGLICGISPYSMQRPVTAAEAQRIQEEQARAAAAAPPAEPATAGTRSKSRKKRIAKVKATKPAANAIATRTPAPPAAQ